MKKYLQEYCVGCGLCQSEGKAILETDKKGYYKPLSGDVKWMEKVCPAAGSQCSEMDFSKIWGKEKAVYYGYSNDEAVRTKASSGGVLTEVTSYLLESGTVDAVLHTCMSLVNPTETEICVSTSRNELTERCGSRYAISHPLKNLSELPDKRYAFVGKPCDIVALKNYLRECPDLEKKFPITLSFFCAGLPSTDAQSELIKQLGCTGKVKSLRYRGNGWPGYATAVQEDGCEHQMDYDSSWGKILGRDVMKMCRFCLDGIGEMADISCGDAWYLTEDMKPDFTENQGRNVVFARTDLGNDILKNSCNAGNITLTDFSDYDDKLKYMQFYQHDRRATMLSKSVAMRIMGKTFPKYSSTGMKKYSKETTSKRNKDIFKGTVKRILKGKI